MEIIQLRTKEVSNQRDLFIQQQQGLCPLCQQPIERPCLDHAHQFEPHEHHVRGACCAQCNSCLGGVWKKLQRAGLISRLGVDGAVQWLVNAGSYYQQDYSMNPYHPNRCTDLARKFKSKTKQEQLNELTRLGISAAGTKEQLQMIYQKHIKQNPH
ncbi:endonuclease domain-containing protein [Aeromonas sp.]|uniref:endonuclease domain-containing protein n=1 Tax=Aeromonas sp. TaxID=647 RepID=UPI00338EEC07